MLKKHSPAFIGVCTASIAIVGGNWNNDLNAGPFNVNLNNDASNTNTNNGAALSYPDKKKSHYNAVHIAA